MLFGKLDDSPMFRKQLQALEESAEALRERSQKFYKGCRKYTEGLGEAYDEDIAFATSLEAFGGGHNDPIGVAFGGPVMTKYTIALREIGTYKEVLRSQVEHMLNEKLMQFVNVELQDVKEVRKRFDKASVHYDQAREKYLSLRKSTKVDIVAEAEEELRNARSSFEQARFNLVSTLSNIEAKKKYEFLEAVSGTMDAHLRYFKQGYELLHQMEPYIHQVLAYVQQSRERTNYEQAALAERMQEFKRQIDRESRWSFSGAENFPTGDGIQAVGRSSHKMIEAAMQSTAKGKVQTIRQGYLSKRSSNLRGDWKRRFFVLDSRGMLYYYRKHWGKQLVRHCSHGNASHHSMQRGHHATDHVSSLLGRLLSSHHHGASHDERPVAHHTVNLLTSTIKVDAEQTDLRFCFTIISPTKSYTLQAENAMDRMDWIEKITGVIASLLSSQLPEQRLPCSPLSSGHQRTASESSSLGSSTDFDHTIVDDNGLQRCYGPGICDHSSRGLQGCRTHGKQESPLELLRKVPGNDVCADCGSPEPDWASLNLGILLCIECSGVHRNLGVHISKVRSLTLDVKVWEPSVLNLFQSLGNTYANSVWEEFLEPGKIPKCDGINGRQSDFQEEIPHMPFRKPNHRDTLQTKEKFIQAKYSAKSSVFKRKLDPEAPSIASQIWDAVRANNKQMVYHLIVNSDADVNTMYEQARANNKLHFPKVTIMRRGGSLMPNNSSGGSGRTQLSDSPTTSTSSITDSDDLSEVEEGLQQCSLLHLACYYGDLGMVELLLQYAANLNVPDHRGRTPLHLCVSRRMYSFAKLLINRGASVAVLDGEGKTPLQRATELGNITDEDLLVLFNEPHR